MHWPLSYMVVELEWVQLPVLACSSHAVGDG